MSKKAIIIFIIAAILVVTAGVYFLLFKGGKFKEGAEGKYGVGIDFNVGVDVSDVGKGTENPLKDMPPTNPLEEVTNPFRDAYKNPFK